MKNIIIFIAGFITMLFSSCVFLSEANSVSDAEIFINKFCEAEFNGVEERFDYVKYSKEREEKEEAKDSILKGMVIQWDGDPLFVIGGFSVLNVQVNDNKGVATIRYERLASTVGEGSDSRKLIVDKKDNDIVNVNLINDGNRWWVIDPLPPRISKKALTDFYKNRIERMGSDWDKKTDLTDPQKQFYLNSVETFNFLKEIGDSIDN